ncbi:hypothetical protein PLICRDRAFT_51526 [Plicaturopsis crispa FD-325 SS-3]|nr:hypothetical protein PLICRDRAFT_51526 [Plicaturopsis crispa FD-325 SS-3]
MKLKEIHRTSTFAWSPTPSLPLLATGTVAGALDESFSNESQLEIWAPDFLDKQEYDLGGQGQAGPKGVVTDSSRFNRLAWGYVDGGRSRGVIAAGLENGELALWDPAKILEHADVSESLILRNTTHTGPIRGLDFNPNQRNLLSSGGVNGEVYIWDLKDPGKPYSPTPGTRSTKLDEMTAVAWNQHVPSVLAGSSSTGYTVVWDLRGKKEVVALAYGGGAGTMAGQIGGANGLAVGGRRGMSDIAWHPDNATRLVTASEDDSSPIIMVWDLRNARAPEKILTGHEKGVLSLSWCKQDADLLLSCGKDNRALCWNPQTSEIIGELPSADNWAFQVDWCPRNPDLLATAFFDGTVGIHSIQSTNEPANDTSTTTARNDAADIFDVPGYSSGRATLSLKQPPRWLRRPTSTSFGYGGKLVSVSNLPSAQGKHQSGVVHVRKVVSEADLVDRASKLQTAIDEQSLSAFAESKSTAAAEGGEGWKALLSLFRADSRDELVTLLGFSKEEIASRVAEAITALKSSPMDQSTATIKDPTEEDITDSKPHEPVVSFAEPERQDESDGEREPSSAVEKTPSEISGSAASDNTNATQLADSESTTTAPSLFGDDNANPQTDAASDFFSTIGFAQSGDPTQNVVVPHHNYGLDSSVAATIGSGPSSVASESLRNNAFRIYPTDESDVDRLVTKALVLGDFESAVSLCLSTDRFADAILLAVKGGPELLQRTQKAYFARRTTSLPYLRLFQSIVTNDLADIVQNADLQEWQEIFVVLCTFASQEEFAGLAEQLGSRLEFQYSLAKDSDAPDAVAKAQEFRKNATLTYLAAGRLERLVNIWIDEFAEEEKALVADENDPHGSQYTAHAHALQTFIEKVTVFRNAIKYVDGDLKQTSSEPEASAKTYKLSGLYERYFEYADLLATQGLVSEAVAFLSLTPADYKGSPGSVKDFTVERERLLVASGSKPAAAVASSSKVPAAPAIPASTSGYPFGTYAPQTQTSRAPLAQAAPAAQPSAYSAYGAAPAPSAPAYAAPSAPSQYQPYSQPNSYNQSQSYSLTQPPHLQTHQQPLAQTPVAPPPSRSFNGAPPGAAGQQPPAPPPKRRDNGGWNDAPVVSERRSGTPGSLNLNKPSAITSPFPNAMPSPVMTPGFASGPPSALPPPPRPGSVNRAPPPPQGSRILSPPQGPGSSFSPPGRPPSGPHGPPPNVGPPSRLMSPSQQQGSPGQPGQYAGVPGQQPPPGPYARATPPPGPPHGAPGHGHVPAGPYAHPAPPPGQAGPYPGPPPQQQPSPYSSPQQPSGPYGPPPGAQRGAPPTQAPGPPPHSGGPPPGPGSQAPPPSRAPRGPPPPKYPAGDRSHIPEEDRLAFNVISEQLARLRQTTPPQQKRLVDDLERRINPLFDALNCGTLSRPVVEQLLVLVRAMESHDRDAALAIHVDLLTRGSQTDDIGLWMSGVKQLIMRL